MATCRYWNRPLQLVLNGESAGHVVSLDNPASGLDRTFSRKPLDLLVGVGLDSRKR